MGCAPNGIDEQNSTKSLGLSGEELEERNDECMLYGSFAASNYQNQDWKSAVDNYKYMIDIGCSECACLGEGRDAEDIYTYYGRSYINLNKLDSASYVFKQGLKFLKDDEVLLENAQWTAGKLGNLEEQIYYLD